MCTLSQYGTYMQTAIHYPTIKRLLLNMIPESSKKALQDHTAFTHEKVSKRIELGSARHDLIQGLLMKQTELVSCPSCSTCLQQPD